MNRPTTQQPPAPTRPEQRLDWSMRQFVDDMQRELENGAASAHVARRLYARGVPLHVQQRVLASAREAATP